MSRRQEGFAGRLLAALDAAGVRGEDLASRIGRDPREVTAWLTGRAEPRASTAMVLAMSLGVRSDDLLGPEVRAPRRPPA